MALLGTDKFNGFLEMKALGGKVINWKMKYIDVIIIINSLLILLTCKCWILLLGWLIINYFHRNKDEAQAASSLDACASSLAAPYMPGVHRAFHFSEVGKLVPTSAGNEMSFVRPWVVSVGLLLAPFQKLFCLWSVNCEADTGLWSFQMWINRKFELWRRLAVIDTIPCTWTELDIIHGWYITSYQACIYALGDLRCHGCVRTLPWWCTGD